MKLNHWLNTVVFAIAINVNAQSLRIPTLQTFYGVNTDHHLIGFSKQYSNGLGYLGFGTISAVGPSQYSDKFFAGPSYTFFDIANTNFSATVSPGIWTTGAIYNFPLYPVNYGVATQISYQLSDAYFLRLGINVNKEKDFNTNTIGFAYSLGERFFPAKKDSTIKRVNLAFTYGGNLNGHIFLLETTFSNNLGFQTIALSDVLHPSPNMVDRFYLGPSFMFKEDILAPFDVSLSLGVYTTGPVNNYPILPASNIKMDYNWKKRIAFSAGVVSLPLDNLNYSYLGMCFSI